MDENGRAATRAPFETIWRELPRRSDLEAASVLDTVTYDAPETRGREQGLPKVGHLATLGEALGRGGSGEVLSAEQSGLARKIAVKRPLQGAYEDELTELLLREARVIGYLEHPNIPPVHFVGVGDDNTLLVALKQIEGANLHERLQQERGLANLEENLDILIQVSNAVGFAHTRGILHLDLKPGNVMTGRHGEVYVLDWGLAVAYRDDLAPGLPRPRIDGQVRGTPGFVAPETVIAYPSSPATDVYQLGGILHYLLTHTPPNAGTTSFEALRASYEPASRSFPAEVPEALAAICIKALAVEPRHRYADAKAFREALMTYRRNRGAVEAIATARIQITALQSVINAAPEDGAEVYQSYGRTRQAIEVAVQLDGQNQLTRNLLQAALETLIRWELSQNNAGAATYLLSELPSVDAELTTAVEELQVRRAGQMEELRALRDEINPSIGINGKLRMVIAMGIVIATVQIAPLWLGVDPSPRNLLAGDVSFFVLILGASIRLRDQLFKTQINRSLTLMVWMLCTNGILLRIGSVQGLLSIPTAIGYDLALCALINVYVASLLDRRFYYSLPTYALACLACFLWPAQAILIFGVGHLIALTCMALALAYLDPSSGSGPETAPP